MRRLHCRACCVTHNIPFNTIQQHMSLRSYNFKSKSGNNHDSDLCGSKSGTGPIKRTSNCFPHHAAIFRTKHLRYPTRFFHNGAVTEWKLLSVLYLPKAENSTIPVKNGVPLASIPRSLHFFFPSLPACMELQKQRNRA